MSGPLTGLSVVELAGLGPAPFAAMMLADLGADVLRIGRPGENQAEVGRDVLNRGKRNLVFDLKTPAGRDATLDRAVTADVLLEGFRPGVGERLGVGAETCLELNPRLVYGRMSGWGRDGTLSDAAGHDVNFIALSGVLSTIGERGGPPVVPAAYVGDFGGGAMTLLFGVMSALWERERSGLGQIVDASIVDGSAALAMSVWGFTGRGVWSERGENLIDGGHPFYGVFRTSDDRYVSLGPLEPAFRQQMLEQLGLAGDELFATDDRALWAAQRVRVAELVAERSRDEWSARLEGTDVCFAPVLSMSEAPQHPHNLARNAFVTVDGVVQPAPTPRFSRTGTGTPRSMSTEGAS